MWIAQNHSGRINKFKDDPEIQDSWWVSKLGNCGVLQEATSRKIKGWKNSLINLETHDYKIEDGILIKVEKENSKRHKHADLIHAWAEGAEIEYRKVNGDWDKCHRIIWDDESEYRIKPKTKIVRFRNYIDADGRLCVSQEETINEWCEWIGSWQEIEVPVEA